MFQERLAKILEKYGLTAKEFAEKMEVQRSSISHLLNGRNKPSFDFVARLSSVFPELNSEWILHGKEPMVTEDTFVTSNPVPANKQVKDVTNEISTPIGHKHSKRISRIIVFYDDGSFEELTNT